MAPPRRLVRQSRKSAADTVSRRPLHRGEVLTGITIRLTLRIVKGRSSSASMTPNTATLAPTPNASVTIIAIVVVGCLRSERIANRTSISKRSIRCPFAG